MGSSATAFLVSLGAAIGFDAVHEVRWVTEGDPLTRFTKGEIEAFLAHPPEVQQLQSSGVGHVLISSTRDRPWAQYYCCMLGVNNGYLSRHPVATKAVVRAMLRAADICSTDPARAARRIIERRVTEDYDTTVRTLRDIPYGKWRDYSAEDTMRFYALRLHEAGMIRSTPAKIIAKGTDWRFLNEVKRELAG
jgi:NitT/TauT family transport system substrate-binding protein